jgi:hypothetical protein
MAHCPIERLSQMSSVMEEVPPNAVSGRLPKELRPIYGFHSANATSFTLLHGSPLQGFLATMGASGLMLGAFNALTPFFQCLQIFAARRIREGEARSFVLRGWSARTFVVICMPMIALASIWLPSWLIIGLALVVLTYYNMTRGYFSAGWMPWMMQIVPERMRGRYLAVENNVVQIASITSMLLSVLILKIFSSLHADPRLAYAIIFALSFVAALISLRFLRICPDRTPGTEIASPASVAQVPYRTFFSNRPFRRYLLYTCLYYASIAGAGTLYTSLIKYHLKEPDWKLIFIPVILMAIVLVINTRFGRILDRCGSRPIMETALTIMGLHFGLWGAVAAGLIPFNWWIIIVLQVTGALSFLPHFLASTKLLMGTVPTMGRTQAFAINSVVSAVSLGVMSLVWGQCLDWLKPWHFQWGLWQWNAWSVLYSLAGFFVLCCLPFAWRLHEEKFQATAEFIQDLVQDFLVESPVRLWRRFWG